MKLVAGFLAAAVLATAAGAQSEERLAWSTNSLTLDTRSADACAPTVVERFSRYSVVRLAAVPSPRYALVVQRFEVGSGCFEGFDPARVDVYAKPLDTRTGKVGEKPLWSFVTEGVAGEVVAHPANALYRVDMPGCCGAAKTEKYFSLQTGRLVASSTSSLLSLESSKDRDVRFVAVEDSIASSPQGPAGVMATVYFGDAEEARETVTISAGAEAERHGWSAGIAWKGNASAKHLTLPGFSDASVELRLTCLCDAEPVRIEIPIVDDGLDERNALVEGMPGIVLSKTRRGAAARRTAASPATPAAAVQAFFDYLLKPKTNIATDAVAQRRWLTADLRKRLIDVTATVKAARKAGVEGPEPAIPDNGVFLDSWDYPTACRVSEEAPPPADKAQAEVGMLCEWGWGTNYAGATRKASVSVIREGGVWRISDVRMRKNKYSAEVDLLHELEVLKSQAEEPARPSGEPREEPGKLP